MDVRENRDVATTGSCANCGAPLVGPYCAQCGQPHDVHRRSVAGLLHDVFEDIISFDSRILRTALALLAEPGELPLAFREGRTQRYVPAVRLYFFVSLLFFLFLSLSGIALLQLRLHVLSRTYTTDKVGHFFVMHDGVTTPLQDVNSGDAGSHYILGPAEQRITLPKPGGKPNVVNIVTTEPRYFERIGADHPHYSRDVVETLNAIKADTDQQLKAKSSGMNRYIDAIYATMVRLQTDPAALNGTLTAWLPRILFLLLPLFALLLALFYRKRRRELFFVDHLVFSLTLHTFAFVVLIAAAIAAQALPGDWVAVPTLGGLALYLLLAMKRFYGESWRRSGLKFVGVAGIYTAFILLPVLVGTLVASMLATSSGV